MFKKVDKFFDELYKKRLSSEKFALILLISGFIFVAILLAVPNLLANILVQFPYFSSIKIEDLISAIRLSFVFFISIFFFLYSFHNEKQDKKARERLKNRQLSDYVEKYQYYVDLVKELSHKEEYKALKLDEEWLKHFDTNITTTAHWINFNTPYSDFEIAACLMYALTFGNTDTLYTRFAFDCAKAIISNPKLYVRRFIEGGELQLEVKEYLESVDFSIPDKEVSEESILAIISTYLSLKDYKHVPLQLANFLNLLAIRQANIQ